jgi:hypothetical protein
MPQGDLCKLVSRNIYLNVLTYLVGFVFLMVFSVYQILSIVEKNTKKSEKLQTKAKLIGFIGLIVVGGLVMINALYYEVKFDHKCKQFEARLDKVIQDWDLESILARVERKGAQYLQKRVGDWSREMAKGGGVGALAPEILAQLS